MEQHKNVMQLLERIQHSAVSPLIVDQEGIAREYAKERANKSATVIKVLSVLGGFLATLTFLGFLFIGGVYDSSGFMIVLGLVFIVGAIALNRAFDSWITGTFSVTTFISGFVLLTIGCTMEDMDERTIIYLLLTLTLISLFLTQNYILTFVSVVAINGYIAALYVINNAEGFMFIYINALTLLITFVFLREGAILSLGKKYRKLYAPVRAGLVFSLFSVLLASHYRYLPESTIVAPWMSSIMPVLITMYLINVLLTLSPDRTTVSKAALWGISLLILIPTAFAPAILCSLLILLLSFYVNYKTGLVLAILAFLYFTSVFYYDLHMTLLVKSGLLFFSGVLFIVLYLLTNRKLKSNEEI